MFVCAKDLGWCGLGNMVLIWSCTALSVEEIFLGFAYEQRISTTPAQTTAVLGSNPCPTGLST